MEGTNRAKARAGVAFCGTRGLPANYGGFETAVDEIGKRVVEGGYECVVFCRESSGGNALKYHEGRKLAYVRGSSRRSLDTFFSAFQTGWQLLRHRKTYDHVFWFNNANLPGILLTLLARILVSVNTDGMEWRRAKWKWPFKAYYVLASLLISLLCTSVISNSKAMQSFYKKTFKKTQFIPYGIPRTLEVPPARAPTILDRYRVEAGRYFLQITRFEPDNLPLEVIGAFEDAALGAEGFSFLLVGYQRPTPYAQQIKEMDGRGGIVVADAVYDAEIFQVLRENCFCYVHGNIVGGTNPALLAAMANCPRVLAIECRFSREVLGDEGCFFEPDDVAYSLRGILKSPDQSANMRSRAGSRYDWDSVAEAYMRVAEGRPADYLTAVWQEKNGASRDVKNRAGRAPEVQEPVRDRASAPGHEGSFDRLREGRGSF